MTSIPVNGISLETAERGSGEPLVLVHGSASDYRTWQIQQEEFGKRFRTIVNSSHIMHEDNPSACNSAVLSFLDRAYFR
jgi:non-heme chloroperoxidase